MEGPGQGPDIVSLIAEGDTEAVARCVARHPATARARGPDGVSALLHALYRGRRDIAELLDAAGAERDVFNAAGLGRGDRLRELLEADPGCCAAWSSDGWTALHLAAFFGHEAAVRLLLQHGADVRAVSRNAQANHPLHAACAAGKTEVALLLLNAGADPSYLAAGFRPLHVAAANGMTEVVQALLGAGASVDARDRDGRNARDHARERGHTALEAMLAAAGG